jgi:hypothetical protein
LLLQPLLHPPLVFMSLSKRIGVSLQRKKIKSCNPDRSTQNGKESKKQR